LIKKGPAGIQEFDVTVVWGTLQLYREALRATGRSLARGWMIAVAVVIFAGLMLIASAVAAPLGILGGFMLGAVNSLLIGATLGLVEQAVRNSRRLEMQDIKASLGQYFWDVISVGFVLWLPIMILDKAASSNPYGPFLAAAVFLLIFILLNPAPEVIYQVQPGSPLDVIRLSYHFVIENWIEWFLPLAIVVAPFGLSFFFAISERAGRGALLDFFQILVLPFRLLEGWLSYLGLPSAASATLVILLTPLAAVAILIFRGHLFAALHGSTRRKRAFYGRV
jgi:hypothetical protein